MIEITLTENEADLLLDKLVAVEENTPLSNVYNTVLKARINDNILWKHIKKNFVAD